MRKPGLLIAMSTHPGASAGVVAVQVVPLPVKVAVRSPNHTAETVQLEVSVMVTLVPPAVVPYVGVNDETTAWQGTRAANAGMSLKAAEVS